MNLIILNGSPICVVKTDFVLTVEEKKCILDLNYKSNKKSEKCKISEDTQILKKKRTQKN